MFVVRRESNSGVYFAGMFRVANVEFIPEYRHADSSEFLSMANPIQNVVSEADRHCINIKKRNKKPTLTLTVFH